MKSLKPILLLILVVVVTTASTAQTAPPPPPGGAPPGFPIPGIFLFLITALGYGLFNLFKNPKK